MDVKDSALDSSELDIEPSRRRVYALLILPAIFLLFAGCKPETKAPSFVARPVRTVTAERGEIGELVVLTGEIKPKTRPLSPFASAAASLKDWLASATTSNLTRCWRSSTRRTS